MSQQTETMARKRRLLDLSRQLKARAGEYGVVVSYLEEMIKDLQAKMLFADPVQLIRYQNEAQAYVRMLGVLLDPEMKLETNEG